MKIILCLRICTSVGRSLGLLEPAVATVKGTEAFAELDLKRMNLFYMISRKGKHCNKVSTGDFAWWSLEYNTTKVQGETEGEVYTIFIG